MPMLIATPQDIYYTIASFGFIVLGVLTAFLLYKLIALLHKINNIAASVEDAAYHIEHGIADIAERASSVAAYGGIVAKAVQGAVGMYQKKSGRRSYEEDEDEEEVVVKRRRRAK